MSKGRHQQTIDQYRQHLANREQQAVAQLERGYQHVQGNIQPALNKLYDQMVNMMANGEKIPIHWLYEAQRLENLKKLIASQMSNYGELSQMTVSQLQQWAVQLGQMSAQDLLNGTVPPGVQWTFGMPKPEAIANLIGATQNGSPLADLFRGFGSEAAENVGKALVQGITLGDNPRKVAKDVQQALGIERNRALTLCRDTLNNSYRSANLEVYRANDDVCDGWVWTADLSPRTCAVCIAMNGTVHPLSEDFEGHPNDRCVPVPQTKSWADILAPLGIDTSNIEDTSADIPSGEDWFDQQSETTQRTILGNAKYNAYADGALSLSDLVYHGHDPDWGGYRQEKSLKDAIGAKNAAQYYGK